MTYTFPKDFLWGTATAAHQVEGNNVNNDTWVMEHVPDSIYVEPSGDACDHYHRYPEDIVLLETLGFNMYRFSIEWARIEPEDGFFSQAELDHYRRMLECCHEYHLKPVVTLHHFTTPRWIMKLGGWESMETANRFARYCEKVGQELGDLIHGACTLNEANISSMFAWNEYMPSLDLMRQATWWQQAALEMNADPQKMLPFLFASTEKARQVIVQAHHLGAQALKSGRGSFPVGITLALQEIQATPGGEEVAARARYQMNDSWLETAHGDDFVGVQTYSRQRFGSQGAVQPDPEAEVTQMGYEFYPEALEATIRETAAVAGVPIIVTENGIGTQDDSRRIAYVERALHGVIRCLQDGIDVRGFTYWSALDNYEWMLGYRPTFGLCAVDRATQVRTPKPSAHWLGKIAQANQF
jgi:beta-glucosidase